MLRKIKRKMLALKTTTGNLSPVKPVTLFIQYQRNKVRITFTYVIIVAKEASYWLKMNKWLICQKLRPTFVNLKSLPAPNWSCHRWNNRGAHDFLWVINKRDVQHQLKCKQIADQIPQNKVVNICSSSSNMAMNIKRFFLAKTGDEKMLRNK